MKDELGGRRMVEWIALAPKMYSFLTEDDINCKKAKGIPGDHVKNRLKHQDYKDILFGLEKDHSVTACYIQSKNQKLYTIEQTKIGLTNHDSKRVMIDDGTYQCLSYGHYRLNELNMWQELPYF